MLLLTSLAVEIIRVVKFLGGNDGFLSGGKVGTLRKIAVLSIKVDRMLSSE